MPGSMPGNRRRASQKLVENGSERINVAAHIDTAPARLGLFGTHVLECADDIEGASKRGAFVQGSPDGFRDTEIDHLRDGAIGSLTHEDVCGLDVAMDDALLMR